MLAFKPLKSSSFGFTLVFQNTFFYKNQICFVFFFVCLFVFLLKKAEEFCHRAGE